MIQLSRDSTAIFSATVTNIFAHGGPQIPFLFSNSVIVSLKEVFWHSSLLPHHCCFFFFFFFVSCNSDKREFLCVRIKIQPPSMPR